MVVYLPLAFLKDWICGFLNTNNILAKFKNGSNDTITSSGLDIPLRVNDVDMTSCLLTDQYLSEREEGWPLIAKDIEEPYVLEWSREPRSWDIAKGCLLLAPIWFATEVPSLMEAYKFNFHRLHGC